MLTMNQAVKDIEGKVNLVNVYLENGIQEDKTKEIEQFIKQKDGVKDLCPTNKLWRISPNLWMIKL